MRDDAKICPIHGEEACLCDDIELLAGLERIRAARAKLIKYRNSKLDQENVRKPYKD